MKTNPHTSSFQPNMDELKREETSFEQVRKKRAPLLAKLGILSFAAASLASFSGFLFSTLSKQSAQLLSASLVSALLATVTTLFATKRTGLVNFLPAELEKPLFDTSVLDAYQESCRNFDMQVFIAQTQEVAPLLIALTEEEQNRCIDNMSSKMQYLFRSKGFLSLLPPAQQELLLPSGVAPRLFPAVNTPPNLTNQNSLFVELLHTRMREGLDQLELMYPSVYYGRLGVAKVSKFIHFLREQSGNDTQVMIIMSVFAIFVLRIFFVLVAFVVRKFFGVFYL